MALAPAESPCTKELPFSSFGPHRESHEQGLWLAAEGVKHQKESWALVQAPTFLREAEPVQMWACMGSPTPKLQIQPDLAALYPTLELF